MNPRLVRGLDYYSRTVFEWITDALGAQDAVCSGGRYDGLVAQLGGDADAGHRLRDGRRAGRRRCIAQAGARAGAGAAPDVYLVAAASAPSTRRRLAEALRDALPGRA